MTRDEAARATTQLFYQTMMSSATISSALQLPEVFPELQQKVFRSHMDGAVMKELLGTVIVPSPSEQDFEKFAVRIADQATVNAETVLSAAVIVLAHSNADDAFTRACQIAMELDPDGWLSEVNQDRTVTMGDLRSKTVAEIHGDELKHFSNRLGAKSIVSRSDLLFKHVPIKKHQDISVYEDAYYKREKLKEADDLRQAIVHGSSLPQIPITKSESVFRFLNEAASTAGRSIAFHYKLPVNFAYFKELVGVKD